MTFNIEDISFDSFIDMSILQEVFKYLAIIGGISLIFGLLMLISIWRIYVKLGKPGWASIVPIYNAWVFFQCGGLPGWLVFIPIANIIGVFVAEFNMAKKLGKGTFFGLATILFPYIFLLVLGLGKSKAIDNDDDSNDGEVQGFTDVVETVDLGLPNTEVNEDISLDNNMVSTSIEVDNKALETTEVKEEINSLPVDSDMEIPKLDNNNVVNLNAEETIEMPKLGSEVKKEEEVNAFNMTAVEDADAEYDVLDITREIPQSDNPDVPDMVAVNEAINEDVTATKKCFICGHENAYSHKVCVKCGTLLD